MTATRDVTIWCDHGGPMKCGAWITGDTAASARREGRTAGWRYESGHGLPRDLCPKHAETEQWPPTSDG